MSESFGDGIRRSTSKGMIHYDELVAGALSINTVEKYGLLEKDRKITVKPEVDLSSFDLLQEEMSKKVSGFESLFQELGIKVRVTSTLDEKILNNSTIEIEKL